MPSWKKLLCTDRIPSKSSGGAGQVDLFSSKIRIELYFAPIFEDFKIRHKFTLVQTAIMFVGGLPIHSKYRLSPAHLVLELGSI